MKRRYLIVGSGLIGTSVALALRAHGHTVLLSDIDPGAVADAVAASGGQPWDSQAQVDMVIVATPPATTAEVVRHMVQVQLNAVVVDVSSVKAPVLEAIADLPDLAQARIVGSHPMAGREVSGARGAQGNLFVDRPWVITRTEHSSEQAVAAVRDLVGQLGAIAVERTANEHDRAVALVSHAPQVVASVLAAQLLNAPSGDVELAGQGIRDTIRIAGSDPILWSQILAGNARHVATQLDEVATGLAKAADAVRSGDPSAIAAVIAAGSAGRDRLPGKHGTAKAVVATMVVRLDDRPGELARLFTVAAQAQVNLEDVRIDHSMGRMTGLVELSVAPTSANELAQALEAEGFKVVG